MGVTCLWEGAILGCWWNELWMSDLAETLCAGEVEGAEVPVDLSQLFDGRDYGLLRNVVRLTGLKSRSKDSPVRRLCEGVAWDRPVHPDCCIPKPEGDSLYRLS